MILFIIIFIGINCLNVKSIKSEEYNLELVQTFFRHGDRTPKEEEIYPMDPYNASVYDPFGYGQLTNLGKQREYEIGQVLRERYDKFLGDTYKPDYIYAYSTNSDRTKMSLQLVLASLFPPNKLLKWNDSLNWIPIPTQYNPMELDFLSTSQSCPEYEKLLRKVSKSSEVYKKILKYENIYRYIMNKTGLTTKEFLTVTTVYNVIQAQESMGLPLPDWLSDEVYEKLIDMSSLAYEIMSFTPTICKIGSGPTIKKIIENINNQEFRNNSKKIYLYAVHGKNVGTLLRSHGLTFPRVPQFGMAAIFEKLRGPDNAIYIRIIVWTGKSRKLVPLKLKNCNEICALKKYLEIVKPVLPDGSGLECTMSELKMKTLEEIVNGAQTNELSLARLICGDDVSSFKYFNKTIFN